MVIVTVIAYNTLRHHTRRKSPLHKNFDAVCGRLAEATDKRISPLERGRSGALETMTYWQRAHFFTLPGNKIHISPC